MKKAILLAGALLAVSASLASAAGLNLGWTNCGPVAGLANKTFACNSNTATAHKLYGSYVAPAGTTAITGNEVVIDLQSSATTLPAWWSLFTATSCRPASLSANFIDPGASGDCIDYWQSQASGGVGAYNTNIVPGATNRARILLVAAVAPANAVPVDADAEYYSFTLQIGNQKTVGTGACAGCTDPVCIVLNEIKLTQPAGVGDFRIQNPANRNYVTWQNPNAAGGCPAATPARNTTWGQVKSLYR
ncbi:MAG: hypothetical protein U0704_17150 [Candidatus Eisenbacteria bacterium]